MNEVMAIDAKRRELKVPIARLCAQAEVSVQCYFDGRAGKKAMTPRTKGKLATALKRFQLGFGSEASALAPSGAYRVSIILAAFYLKVDPRKVSEFDPGRRATMDPAWKDAANARRVAFWITTQMLGFRGADVGRAAGVTRAAVSAAVKELEIQRDHDAQLDQVLNQLEEVLS
jgi:hypothetical protein